MAPFSAAHSVILPHPLQPTFDTISSEEKFKELLMLSPSSASVELLSIDPITLSNVWIDTLLKDSEGEKRAQLNVPDSAAAAKSTPEDSAAGDGTKDDGAGGDSVPATRYKIKLTERFVMMGGVYKQDIVVFGTQIVIPSRHLHVYDSLANGGVVKILKIRRFEPAGVQGEMLGNTRISEQVRGDTTWILRSYSERECRRAHTVHMDNYHKLME